MRAVVPLRPVTDPEATPTSSTPRPSAAWWRTGVALVALTSAVLVGLASASADTATGDSPQTVTVGQTFQMGVTITETGTAPDLCTPGETGGSFFTVEGEGTVATVSDTSNVGPICGATTTYASLGFTATSPGTASLVLLDATSNEVARSTTTVAAAAPSASPSALDSPSRSAEASASESASVAASASASPSAAASVTLTIDGVGGTGPVELVPDESYVAIVTGSPGFQAEVQVFGDEACSEFLTAVAVAQDEAGGDGTAPSSPFTYSPNLRSFRAIDFDAGTVSDCLVARPAAPASPSDEASPSPVDSPSPSPSASDDPSASPSADTTGSPSAFIPASPSVSPSPGATTGTVEVVFAVEVPDDTVVTLGETSQIVGGVTTQGLISGVSALAAPAGTVVTFADVAPGDSPLTVEVGGAVRFSATVTVVAGLTTTVTVEQLDPVGASERPSRAARPSVDASVTPSAAATTAPVASVAAAPSTAGGATTLPDTGTGGPGAGTTGWLLAALLAVAAVALGGLSLRRPRGRRG